MKPWRLIETLYLPAAPDYEREWGVRHCGGDVEPAGILGEQRAVMVARSSGGTVVSRASGGPWRDEAGQ